MTLPVRRLAAALALGAALATTGCGVGDAGRAATVDGRVISEDEVQEVRRQINATFPTANLSPADVLSRLIQAPVILDFATQQGAPVSESVARQAYTGQESSSGGEPTAETLQLLRAELAFQGLQQSGAQIPVTSFEQLDVEVSPRYGTFDPQSASVAAALPEWVTPYTPDQ